MTVVWIGFPPAQSARRDHHLRPNSSMTHGEARRRHEVRSFRKIQVQTQPSASVLGLFPAWLRHPIELRGASRSIRPRCSIIKSNKAFLILPRIPPSFTRTWTLFPYRGGRPCLLLLCARRLPAAMDELTRQQPLEVPALWLMGSSARYRIACIRA